MRVRDNGTSERQGASGKLPRIARGWRPLLGVITSRSKGVKEEETRTEQGQRPTQPTKSNQQSTITSAIANDKSHTASHQSWDGRVHIFSLFLLSGRCCRLLRRSGLGLNWLRLESLQNRRRASPPGSVNRQGDGSDHESHSRPGGGLGEGAGGAARTKRGLAALPAERGRDVAALAALQQHDHDDEEADQNVKRCGEIDDHKFESLWTRTRAAPKVNSSVVRSDRLTNELPANRNVWCGRGDLKSPSNAFSTTCTAPGRSL